MSTEAADRQEAALLWHHLALASPTLPTRGTPAPSQCRGSWAENHPPPLPGMCTWLRVQAPETKYREETCTKPVDLGLREDCMNLTKKQGKQKQN